MFGRKLKVSTEGFPWWVAGGMHSTCSSAALHGREPRRRNPAPPPTPGSASAGQPGWNLHAAASRRPRPWRGAEWLTAGTASVRCRPPLRTLLPCSLCSPKATTRAGRFTPNSAIVRRFEAVGRRTAGGVPYLDPTIQLLFKAKNPRPEDIADFNAVIDSTP
jgi:hypothetical protein